MQYEYISSLTNYHREHSYKVNISKLEMGNCLPIRVQTMCNTFTSDIEKSVAQIENIALNSPCDLVRLTVPTMNDVENLRQIKQRLIEKNITIPLVADVHFNAKIALECAKFIDKVRINPGNFSNQKRECLTEEEYEDERQNLENNFREFLAICKEHNTAVRIGANHGSLSRRILNRYGNTPEGLVESVMEFLRVAKKENFYNLVISLKSSNPLVVNRACRLLNYTMKQEDMHYAIHLGVTEAGQDLLGRMKSYAGIGPLLCDGIGDTIRVSLTEEPIEEIAPAKLLCNYALWRTGSNPLEEIPFFYNPYKYQKRVTKQILDFGANNPARAILNILDKETLIDFVEYLSQKDDSKRIPDYILVDQNEFNDTIVNLNKDIKIICKNPSLSNSDRILQFDKYFVELNEKSDFNNLDKEKLQDKVIIISPKNINKTGSARLVFYHLNRLGIDNPVIFKPDSGITDPRFVDILPSLESSAVFMDGFGDGLMLDSFQKSSKTIDVIFDILQICRLRITANEYISCPGCGRTLYNLQDTARIVKQKTSKYKGLKIAVMGCIVNGPGEMADADYGYVGSGHGKVTLYKQKQIVKQNIDENLAVEELIKLIEENL